MTDQFDDDGTWWRTIGDRKSERRAFERTREHRVVRHDAAPVSQAAGEPLQDHSEPDTWVEPRPTNDRTVGVDPRLMRLGAIAAAAVLLVPVVVAVTAGASDGDELQSDGAATVETTVAAQPLSEATEDTGVPISAAVSIGSTIEPADVDEDAEAAAASAGEKGRPESVDDADESGDSGEESEATIEASETTAAAQEDVSDEPECAGTYTVVAGDYWLRFVDSSGASLDEWLAANSAEADTQIYEGDELCIPAGAQTPAAIAAPQSDAPAPATDAGASAATTTAPEATTTAAPPPPPPPAPPAPSPDAPSTSSLCGSMPTDNGSPPGVAGPAEVEAIIREIWPDDIEVRALCIAKNEANLRPDLNNWCCYGVFALYFRYVPDDLKAQYGVDSPNDLWDARTNIAIAYQIYLRGGWEPWSQTDPGSG